MNLDASSGQINIIPANTNLGAEVSIHTLGAIGIGKSGTVHIPDL